VHEPVVVDRETSTVNSRSTLANPLSTRGRTSTAASVFAGADRHDAGELTPA
jgi:hypothetical protein